MHAWADARKELQLKGMDEMPRLLLNGRCSQSNILQQQRKR